MLALGFRLCILVLLCLSCASPASELHLAPLVSNHTLPGWSHSEALGGLFQRTKTPEATEWAFSPLWWQRRENDGRFQADFLMGFGRREYDPNRPRTLTRFFPLGWHEVEKRPDGITERDWAMPFLGMIGSSSSDDKENAFAAFPFFGKIKDFLTYDEIDFVLWPFFIRNKKGGRESTHIFWPFFNKRSGTESGWEFFPFYGTSERPGKSNHQYWMWPFFNKSEEFLNQSHPKKSWLLFPLLGHSTQDDLSTWDILPPFFQTSTRPSTELVSFKAWPLIKWTSGGVNSQRKLQRFLPFYLHYEDETTEYTSVLWPLFWVRHDHSGGIEKHAFYALPLFWSSRTRVNQGEEQKRWHLWPLASSDPTGFRALDPSIPRFIDQGALHRNFGFVYQIYATRHHGTGIKEQRAWLGLWRRTTGEGHSRWSMPGIGGQWTEPDGTTHHSYLFGLLRWSSSPSGNSLEGPAFPGPGWPALEELQR